MIEETIIKTDFYIRIDSEADMPEKLSAFYKQDTITVVDPETGEETVSNEGDPYLVPYTQNYALNVVGTIYEPTGVILEDDVPEMIPLEGWHINIRLIGNAFREIVEALDATYGVEPKAPKRVWL